MLDLCSFSAQASVSAAGIRKDKTTSLLEQKPTLAKLVVNMGSFSTWLTQNGARLELGNNVLLADSALENFYGTLGRLLGWDGFRARAIFGFSVLVVGARLKGARC